MSFFQGPMDPRFINPPPVVVVDSDEDEERMMFSEDDVQECRLLYILHFYYFPILGFKPRD